MNFIHILDFPPSARYQVIANPTSPFQDQGSSRGFASIIPASVHDIHDVFLAPGDSLLVVPGHPGETLTYVYEGEMRRISFDGYYESRQAGEAGYSISLAAECYFLANPSDSVPARAQIIVFPPNESVGRWRDLLFLALGPSTDCEEPKENLVLKLLASPGGCRGSAQLFASDASIYAASLRYDEVAEFRPKAGYRGVILAIAGTVRIKDYSFSTQGYWLVRDETARIVCRSDSCEVLIFEEPLDADELSAAA